MDNRTLQNKLLQKTRGRTPDEVLAKFEAAGWHSKRFDHMGVIALHPHYSDFQLGVADTWLYATPTPIRDIQAGQSWLLWVYPDESALSVKL